jgi:hypothetical protein
VTVAPQTDSNAPRAIERIRRIEFINAMLERDLCRAGRDRRVIQTGAAHAQQFSLLDERQGRRRALN